MGVYKKTLNYESLGIGEGNPNSRSFQPFSLCSLNWVDVERRCKYHIDWCVSVCADLSEFVRSLSITPSTVWQLHCNVCVWCDLIIQLFYCEWRKKERCSSVCDEYGRSTTYATPSYTTPKKPIWRHTTRLQCRRYTLPVFLFLHYSSPLEAVKVADVKVTFACHGANPLPPTLTFIYVYGQWCCTTVFGGFQPFGVTLYLRIPTQKIHRFTGQFLVYWIF